MLCARQDWRGAGLQAGMLGVSQVRAVTFDFPHLQTIRTKSPDMWSRVYGNASAMLRRAGSLHIGMNIYTGWEILVIRSGARGRRFLWNESTCLLAASASLPWNPWSSTRPRYCHAWGTNGLFGNGNGSKEHVNLPSCILSSFSNGNEARRCVCVCVRGGG